MSGRVYGLGVWQESELQRVSPFAVMYSLQEGVCGNKEVTYVLSRSWELTFTRTKNVACIWEERSKIGTLFVPFRFRNLCAGTAQGRVYGERVSLSLPRGYWGHGPCIGQIGTRFGDTRVSLKRRVVSDGEYKVTEEHSDIEWLEEKYKKYGLNHRFGDRVGFFGKLFGFRHVSGLFGSRPLVSDSPIIIDDQGRLNEMIGEEAALALSMWFSIWI